MRSISGQNETSNRQIACVIDIVKVWLTNRLYHQYKVPLYISSMNHSLDVFRSSMKLFFLRSIRGAHDSIAYTLIKWDFFYIEVSASPFFLSVSVPVWLFVFDCLFSSYISIASLQWTVFPCLNKNRQTCYWSVVYTE